MSDEIRHFILFVTKGDHIFNIFPSDVYTPASAENYLRLV